MECGKSGLAALLVYRNTFIYRNDLCGCLTLLVTDVRYINGGFGERGPGSMSGLADITRPLYTVTPSSLQSTLVSWSFQSVVTKPSVTLHMRLCEAMFWKTNVF